MEKPSTYNCVSCFKPEELTLDEYVVLAAFYSGRVAQISTQSARATATLVSGSAGRTTAGWCAGYQAW